VPEPTLSVERVSVAYGIGSGRVQALSDVSLSFGPGLTLVQGHSGSGKTTLLSILGCILRPDSGRVWVMDQDITKYSEGVLSSIRRSYVGYVFQAFRLFRALSALENVTLSLALSGWGKREARCRAEASLENLGLFAKRHRLPKELSGGEKQRVAIARALVCDPPIVLADEPTASLDSTAGEQIANILQDLASKESRLVVVVSHDARWRDYSNRTLWMSDGRLVNEAQLS